MEQIFVKARAKINVSLDILGKRDDSYHEIETVMQTLSLYDGLFIKKVRKENYFKLVTNVSWLPTDGRNIVAKAFVLMNERYGFDCGVFIELTKNIPVSAGLGGGSADCAAAIVGLSKLFELSLTKDEILLLARELGADVPFCIEGGTMLARGIGEKLTRLPPHPDICVLLVRPPCVISTADVFNNLDLSKIEKRPDTEAVIRYITDKDVKNIAKSFCNVLEVYTAKKHPVIEDIKTEMMKSGALGASMSGSGPTVFGYFYNTRDAVSALTNVQRSGINVKESRITAIDNAGTY